MLGSLSQCEFSMGKTLLVYDMNLKEMENYETIYTDIGEGASAWKVSHGSDERHYFQTSRANFGFLCTCA